MRTRSNSVAWTPAARNDSRATINRLFMHQVRVYNHHHPLGPQRLMSDPISPVAPGPYLILEVFITKAFSRVMDTISRPKQDNRQSPFAG